MGFFDKLKEKGRGIVSAARPEEGVAPAPVDEVARRLQAIGGRGISTTTDGDAIVVAWAATVASVGAGGGGHENRYRAIRVTLDPAEHTATGLCLKTTTTAQLDFRGGFSGSGDWERGQHIGSETLHVLAWLGPHHTSGGADEKGFTFRWSDLRDPVMDAVTGAGWTYKPKKV